MSCPSRAVRASQPHPSVAGTPTERDLLGLLQFYAGGQKEYTFHDYLKHVEEDGINGNVLHFREMILDK